TSMLFVCLVNGLVGFESGLSVCKHWRKSIVAVMPSEQNGSGSTCGGCLSRDCAASIKASTKFEWIRTVPVRDWKSRKRKNSGATNLVKKRAARQNLGIAAFG